MTETTAEPITEPGVYDIPAEEYHADPVPGGSLSSSGARRLLSPSCPALFRHDQLNPPAPKRTFDFGHAAHKLVLGAGPELVPIDAADWRTKAAKEQRDAAREEGAVPLLAAEYEQVEAMAEALRSHPLASALFNPDSGRPEQALIWRDRPTGVWRRALLDWLRNPRPGRLIIPDYKTAQDVDPESIQRAMDRYGYHQQAAWYLDAVRELGLAGDVDPGFVFVFQMKSPPYLVTVAEPDAMALRIARDRNRQAIELYAECCRTDRWPGYSDDVVLTPLPAWAENRYLQEMTS